MARRLDVIARVRFATEATAISRQPSGPGAIPLCVSDAWIKQSGKFSGSSGRSRCILLYQVLSFQVGPEFRRNLSLH